MPQAAELDRLICLDIETVPDAELIPADWPADRFPKPLWHRLVAVSFVEAAIDRTSGRERYIVDCCRSGGQADYDEARILTAFWRYFGRRNARIVTWNGRGFDLPVLKLRAMMHGITAEKFHLAGDRWSGYGQRYAADWHCDLMECLSDYGAAQKIGLQEMAEAV